MTDSKSKQPKEADVGQTAQSKGDEVRTGELVNPSIDGYEEMSVCANAPPWNSPSLAASVASG